jgi:hypothetical protein
MIHYAKYSDNPDMFEQTQFSKDGFIYNSTYLAISYSITKLGTLTKEVLIAEIKATLEYNGR